VSFEGLCKVETKVVAQLEISDTSATNERRYRRVQQEPPSKSNAGSCPFATAHWLVRFFWTGGGQPASTEVVDVEVQSAAHAFRPAPRRSAETYSRHGRPQEPASRSPRYVRARRWLLIREARLQELKPAASNQSGHPACIAEQ